MTLYEINDQIEELTNRLFYETDEETGEIPDDLVEELEKLKMARDVKLDNIGALMKNLESDVRAIEDEIVNLRARREAKINRLERLEEYVKRELLSHDQTKFESSRVMFSFRKSVKVSISNLEAIPKQYVIETVEKNVDKKSIGQALRRGETVSGAELVEFQNLQLK